MGRFTPESNAEARALFLRAIELDPNYGAAYVGLAYSHHRDLWFEVAESREASIQALLRAARQAVSLDQASSDAHSVLSFGLIWARDLERAIASAQRAVKLNPSNAIAYSQLGIAQSFAGRPRDGIENLERALRLDSQDPRSHFTLTMLARAHLNARDPEAAVRWADAAIHRQGDYPLAHLVRAAALGYLGHIGEAEASLLECERLSPGFATRWALRPMYKDPADDLYFLEGLRKAGLDAEAA